MKINNNIQRFKTVHHLDQEINFSFAQPRSKSANDCYIPKVITEPQRRALRMWIETILEYHSEQFLHALKHKKQFNVCYLHRYIVQFYSHIKSVVRYYIMSSLMDYQCISLQSRESQDVVKQCVFTNIIIQELINRFFRESQWLHKISHLPIYVIFSLFDVFGKGYTTVEQLKSGVSSDIGKKLKIKTKSLDDKKKREMQKLLYLKLRNNVGGSDFRIYQQNIEQLMLRGNLISFQELMKNGEDLSISIRYQEVKRMISEIDQILTERQRFRVQEQLRRQMREREQIELMRQNISIKYKSNMMSKTTVSNQLQNREDLLVGNERKSQYNLNFFQDNLVKTEIEGQRKRRQHYSNQIDRKLQNNFVNGELKQHNRLKLKLDVMGVDEKRYKQSVLMKENNEMLQNVIHNQIVSQEISSISKNIKNIEYREQVFKQLQMIRLHKKENHCRLLNYI